MRFAFPGGQLIAAAAMTSLLAACGSDGVPITETNPGNGFNPTAVAFMSDVHFENIYGDLKNPNFAGIPTKDGRNATIRTMYAELTSTRLFNENYFAFRGALDDAYGKGLRLVALPGDISDDAQPINIDGIADILHEYQAKGMRFFIAPGNHDPNEPFDNDEAGKNDFLTRDGKEQKIYATGAAACKAKDPAVVCTNQLMEQGYEKLLTKLADFGYMPNQNDVYWETPFTKYADGKYSYAAATAAADLGKRQFEICAEGEGGSYKAAGEARLGKSYTRCGNIIDASYLVEPVKGIWLLALDANVHVPNAKFDPANPASFKGYDGAGDAGWNKVQTHKIHQMEWIKSVTERAKAQGKQLMAFSHYPTMDFYANQTGAMKAVFKPGAFQVSRMPDASTTAALAATGLPLHMGGHMHFNGTNDYKDAAGNYLVNVQSPSLAVFGAAYKIVSYQSKDQIDVQTVALNSVPRYNELFPLYQAEYDYLQGSVAAADIAKRWNRGILDTKSYGEFTRTYFGELSRLRFMGDYWPCEMKEAAMSLDARQMLILSQLQTKVTLAQLKDNPGVLPITAACAAKGSVAEGGVAASQLTADWAAATAKAEQIAAAANLKLADFAKISAYEFYGDFHRTVYAGELALRDMGAERVAQYKVLMAAFPAAPAAIVKIGELPSDQNPVHVLFQNQFKQVFAILKGLGSGKPSDHFTIDLKAKTLSNASSSGLSFN
ncbi:metallophosphoesterase [Duganella sp. BJB488]|uniref:metallophosphoesterase family protein n=1 Tax=unclassified Duganella TaxID=2636909 RepID=UPI000E3409D3|nr:MULTISPECIES: metallophosphoesterase [unclassified Duganella]RFP26005.1 metallophosphoesterase [Duganella sp. BJB489]RFP28254.1 metallophosphoesterase [Duganella sp. BJB488]RFP36935.1 metallophosphoesterase [Duganella sp. BJB480]